MSYFNMVCDGCGREVQGYNIVNGMKFCAKCYQEIFGNKNMTENLKNMYEAYLKILNEKDQRIAELEEQLKNAKRETAKKVIDRIEELSVLDFKACEALYMITEPELDCILRELQGEKK